jgi:hypothetical protein
MNMRKDLMAPAIAALLVAGVATPALTSSAAAAAHVSQRSASTSAQAGPQGAQVTDAQGQAANQFNGVQGAAGQPNFGLDPGVQGQSYGRPGQLTRSESAAYHVVVTEQQLRQQLQLTREALRQGDVARADEALRQLDAMIDPGQSPDLKQAIDNARQALRRNDTASADTALQQAFAESVNPQVQRGQRG